ncbi:Xaa-Pro aminopeptidase 2 [Mactra antiquata]
MFLRMLIEIGILALVIRSQALQSGNWDKCKNVKAGVSQKVTNLRGKMNEQNLQAYVVPTGDFHLSEFVSDYDQRRAYISGFTGSMGTAVITQDQSALWTVGKYFLQAETELTCDWILMKEREPGVPTIEEWLGQQHTTSGVYRVGASPYFLGIKTWLNMRDQLKSSGIDLIAVNEDLVDKIWTQDRPEVPKSMLHTVGKYAGVSREDKISNVREMMSQKNIDAVLVTMLDETAWLFNLRGADITGLVNDPFFFSVAIVTQDKVKLFVTDHFSKLSNQLEGYNGTLAEYLHTSETGDCTSMGNKCVEVLEYDFTKIIQEVVLLSQNDTIRKILLSYFCNYAVYSYIPVDKVVVDNTPVTLIKTRKNPTEVQGMTNCHVRDAAALARFATKLEKGVLAGENWTEISAAAELTRFRSLQDLNRGVSFESISATGSNAAVIHYFPTESSNTRISLGETYLIDSGGQYLDGTTDVTRTFFWGEEPSSFIKECYTRVLMGQINLATAVWVKGLYGRDIDAWARQPLFDIGLQYRHGTGHGIGAYLSVHEGPGRISNYHARFDWDIPLDENMFYSDEPGYYQPKQFGIRLENIVYVKKVDTKYTMDDVTMLGLETITLFPYEPHLIDYDLLSDKHISWLNEYNARTLDTVGSLLKEQGDMEAYRWVEKRSKLIKRESTTSSSSIYLPNLIYIFLLSFMAGFKI